MPLTTPSGKPNKLADFENHVKGKMPASEMYAIANKQGLMHGNKISRHGDQPATFGKNDHRPGKKNPLRRALRGAH